MTSPSLPLASLLALAAVALGATAQPCEPYCSTDLSASQEGSPVATDDGPNQVTWSLVPVALASLITVASLVLCSDPKG